MLLHTVYTAITPANRSLGVNLPLAIDLDASIKASLVEQESGIHLLIDRKIDHTKLEIVKESGYYKTLPDGKEEPIPTLRLVDDDAPEHILSEDFMSTLTFLTDVPITLSRPPHKDRFVPETDEDRELLEKFGTDQPYSRISVLSSMRSFSTRGVTNKTVTDLTLKRVGLRLYANAMKANLAVAQFRELWRILEAAFCKKDRELVALLAQYGPASKLGFDETEIKQLWILRGRASHAESRAGIRELVYVDQECTKRLPRLKNLCERVILTKKDWGQPTVDTDELLPLTSFVGPDNGITIFQKHFMGISTDREPTE
jgi:hypothetical protein